MVLTSRRWQLVGLLLLASSLMACNPLAAPFFIFGGLDPQVDPPFKLASKDRKPVKVAIIVSMPPDLRSDLRTADRELTTLLSQHLQDLCKKNNENVVVASSTKVQKFKDEHPMWQSVGLIELGRQLKADYVIDLEINEMSLYEKDSLNTLFLGKTAISVSVVDVHKPEEPPVFRHEFTTEYPRSGSRPVSDTNMLQFRHAFLNKVAAELSWLFTGHPTNDDHSCE